MGQERRRIKVNAEVIVEVTDAAALEHVALSQMDGPEFAAEPGRSPAEVPAEARRTVRRDLAAAVNWIADADAIIPDDAPMQIVTSSQSVVEVYKDGFTPAATPDFVTFPARPVAPVIDALDRQAGASSIAASVGAARKSAVVNHFGRASVVNQAVRPADIEAVRGGERLIGEVKGKTSEPGIDADIAYGQLLRRMTGGSPDVRYALIVPTTSVSTVQRVPVQRVPVHVRDRLRIDLYEVTAGGGVRQVH